MKPVLPLFIMVDACGWEIVRHDPFCETVAPYRHKLDSVFGYSSTCVPSILSGRWPDEHRNWCYFIHDPKNSPFHFLRWLRFVPKALTSRRIVRRLLTKLARPWLGFEGYFDLYNIPFQHIANYDFTEKKSPLKPKGMNRGSNIFDFLTDKSIPYFVSDPDLTEEQNRDVLCENISREGIDFAFMYWPGLDGLLHRVGNDSPEVPAKMRLYEEWIDQVLEAAKGHYEEVRLFVFSDHGMANCDEHVDVMSVINKLPLKFGVDYGAVYDSTMARFWFLKPGAKEMITEALATVEEGRILQDEELKHMRTYFEDGRFGQMIFLLREGALLVPSHMGERPIRAMHGFHPKDQHSYATLMTNQDVDSEIKAIPDIYKLMTKHALAAQSALKESSHTAVA